MKPDRPWFARSLACAQALLALALLCLAIPAEAQIKSIQSTALFTTPDGTTVTSPSFGSAPIVGDKIIVGTWAYGTNPTLTVTDNYGNTYTADTRGTIESAQSAGIFSTTVAKSGTGFQVTVSTANAAQIDAVATEYFGAGAVDQTNIVAAKSATPSVSTLKATSVANELAVSSLSIYLPWNTDFKFITPATGWTTDAVQLNNLNNASGNVAEKTLTSTGVQTASWTSGVTIQEWVAAIATYQQLTLSTACGPVPSKYPITSGTGVLNIGGSSQVNSQDITGTGVSVQTTAVRTSAVPTFPALSPSTYPTFSSNTSANGGTIAAGTYGNVTASGTTTFSGGTYYISSLTVSAQNTTVVFGPGTYFITNANFSGNTLILKTSGAVTINVGSNFSTSGSMTLNSGGSVANLRIYLYPSASLNIGASNTMNGIIYGPGTGNNVNIGSDFQLSGIIAVNSNVTLAGSDLIALSAANATLIGNVSTCGASGGGGAVTPDHFAFTNPATALNCEAAAITLTAHDSSHAAVAATSTVSLSTSTGHGDWSLTSGTGTFTAGTSNSGTATYTYASGDTGAVILALRDTYAETVNLGATSGTITEKSGSAIASEDASLTFAPTGFRITNGSNVATTIATQVAGKTSTQSLAIQAVRTDTSTGACTSLFASGTTATVNLAYQCNNPTSCIAGQTLTVTNNGSSTSIASNGASAITNYTAVPLKFSTANAEAPITLNYSDVGQILLVMSYSIPLASGAASGNTIYGSSQFVVAPYSFVLSNIKRTSDAFANPGASTASGTVFMNAGQAFTATVTATNFNGAATPNYGREIIPETPQLTPNLVLPASGHNPAISGSFGAFSSGVASGTAFSWPEVGIITITPGDSNYLSSGAVTGTTTGNVGRFIPNGFGVALNSPVLGTACSAGGFGYVGQPFTYTVAPVITATAQALGGATAQNYTGALMR